MGLSGGMMGPYLTNLFVHQGIASSQVGIIMSAGKIASIVVQPLWGVLVDRYQQTRLVLMLSLAIPAVLAYFYNLQWFAAILVVYMVTTVFQATQAPISDSYAVRAAKEANTTYGKIRSFGSFGNAIGGYLAGMYLMFCSITALWVPFLLLSLLGLVSIGALPAATERKAGSVAFGEGLRRLLGNRSFLFFLIGCFMINQTLTAFNSYFVLTFQMAGGSYGLSGIALLIASLTNVPAMLVGSALQKKWGIKNVLLLASAAYVLRWGIQWLFPIPEVIVAVQVLHGVSFGFFYVAAVEFVAGSSGKGMQATGQSLFNMVFSGFGGIVGNLLNGYLLEVGGPDLMYLVCAISALAGTLILLFVKAGRSVKEA
ncbi:MFS transporter [Cohnella fermenti]|uniref:MFS transporter n=2 Tax=Cohnella fermenti TaxID=2565925 RepID=A0A4S4BV55_9BACL|nr:MFS transporter [Cohnella fermenti]